MYDINKELDDLAKLGSLMTRGQLTQPRSAGPRIVGIAEEARATISRLTAQLDEARQLVTEANNSLYGSQGYFHSLSGGPFDKYHLASGIEDLKATGRKVYRLTAERDEWIAYADKLEGALRLVGDLSNDQLKRMQANEGLRIVRPATSSAPSPERSA